LRSTVTDLHPAVLHAAGLLQALRELAVREAERARVSIEVDADNWPPGPHARDELLFGTARELLTNIVKHARAKAVVIRLAQTEHAVELVVSDDGVGFDEDVLARRLAEGHIGLASLRTRVAGAGGTVTFRRREPTGSVVTVALPPG
jgi:two-component system NarL family sensor kinase